MGNDDLVHAWETLHYVPQLLISMMKIIRLRRYRTLHIRMMEKLVTVFNYGLAVAIYLIKVRVAVYETVPKTILVLRTSFERARLGMKSSVSLLVPARKLEMS